MASPEELAARYAGRWVICRVQRSGDPRGRWVADPSRPAEDRRLTAGSVEALAEQLKRASR